MSSSIASIFSKFSDGKMDKILTNMDELRTRLKMLLIERQKTGQGIYVSDIKQTHQLHIASNLKPSVPIISMYQKIGGKSGVGVLTNSKTDLQFDLNLTGQFTSDGFILMTFPEIKSTDPNIFFQYCSYPGMRIIDTATYLVDGKVVDIYTTDDLVHYFKFFVPETQKNSWDKCHGQQIFKKAQYYNNNLTYMVDYADGPQTPYHVQKPLTLCIPLHFWFCYDPAIAFYNDLNSEGSTNIQITLSPLKLIIQALTQAPAGNFVPTQLPFDTLPFTATLYINQYFIDENINLYLKGKIGGGLIRVHERIVKNILPNTSEDMVNLLQLKYPVEYLIVTVRNISNRTYSFENWWLGGVEQNIGNNPNASTVAVPSVLYNNLLNVYQIDVSTGINITTLNNPLETFSVSIYENTLIPKLPSIAFNAYLPLRYKSVQSIYDDSSFIIPFNLFPGKSDPSGYYNASIFKQNSIVYSISGDVTVPLEIVVTASCINKIDSKDNKIGLQYIL